MMSLPLSGGHRFASAFRPLWRIATVVATAAVTVVGLGGVTFLIGRFLPADPVVAIVGDRAPADVYVRVFRELHLDQPLY
ncbi:hypothetical protein ABTM85_20045, partial [Acinetobacter baumannii]